MYPVDAIKTRMQVATAVSAPRGVIQATYRMATTEGILSLWRGMSSVIVGAGESAVTYWTIWNMSADDGHL